MIAGLSGGHALSEEEREDVGRFGLQRCRMMLDKRNCDVDLDRFHLAEADRILAIRRFAINLMGRLPPLRVAVSILVQEPSWLAGRRFRRSPVSTVAADTPKKPPACLNPSDRNAASWYPCNGAAA